MNRLSRITPRALSLRVSGAIATALFVYAPAVAWAFSPAEHGGEGAGHGAEGAAGHGGEHGAHHEGIKWIGGATEDDPRIGVIFLVLNFIALLLLLRMILFKGLRQGHEKAREEIKSQLDQATKAREEAETLMAEYKTKLDSLDEELASIKKDAEAKAKEDYERILEEARVEADEILASAESAAEREAERRRRQIENEIVDQALVQAEAAIRQVFGPNDQRAAIDAYVAELGDVDLKEVS